MMWIICHGLHRHQISTHLHILGRRVRFKTQKEQISSGKRILQDFILPFPYLNSSYVIIRSKKLCLILITIEIPYVKPWYRSEYTNLFPFLSSMSWSIVWSPCSPTLATRSLSKTACLTPTSPVARWPCRTPSFCWGEIRKEKTFHAVVLIFILRDDDKTCWLLLHRHLPMIAGLLHGRIHLNMQEFRQQNHMTLFSNVLAILELLQPLVFHSDHQRALQNCLLSFMKVLQVGGSPGSGPHQVIMSRD